MKKNTTHAKAPRKAAAKKSATKNSATQSVYVKIHQREYLGYSPRVVIAICDVNLIGSIYADTKTGATLNLKDHHSFYTGEKMTEKEASAVIAKYANYERASFNFIGQTTLKIAGQYFNTTRAKKIGKAPHLEIYRL